MVANSSNIWDIYYGQPNQYHKHLDNGGNWMAVVIYKCMGYCKTENKWDGLTKIVLCYKINILNIILNKCIISLDS